MTDPALLDDAASCREGRVLIPAHTPMKETYDETRLILNRPAQSEPRTTDQSMPPGRPCTDITAYQITTMTPTRRIMNGDIVTPLTEGGYDGVVIWLPRV